MVKKKEDKKCCNPVQVTVKEEYCTQNIELLIDNIRPCYIPREFTHVILFNMYISPSAITACKWIHKVLMYLQPPTRRRWSSSAGTSINSQYLKCHTRENRTLNLLYVFDFMTIYLTNRPYYVKLHNCVSEVMLSSTHKGLVYWKPLL